MQTKVGSVTVLAFFLLCLCDRIIGQNFTFSPGSLKGSFSTNLVGGAEYRIPITVPPGISKMEPHIAIVYDSHSENGVLGMRFRIDGLSSIVRCGQTLDEDGRKVGRYSRMLIGKTAVTLTQSDRFCMDGIRLIAVRGGYGAAETEYRLQNSLTQKIVSRTQSGQVSPCQFEVWVEDGKVLQFGECETDHNSSLVLNGTTFQWALHRIQDRSANVIDFHYQIRDRQMYLDRIAYGYNIEMSNDPRCQLLFEYQNRTDIIETFVHGFTLNMTQRLSKIRTLVDGTEISTWSLAYDFDSRRAKSLLSSIHQCHTETECMHPTTFRWQYSNSTFHTTQKLPPSVATRPSVALRVFDWDGDGRTDIFATDGGNLVLLHPEREARIKSPADLVDLNSDGLPDSFEYINFSENQVFVSINYNGNFKQLKWSLPTQCNRHRDGDNPSQKFLLTDFNGDKLLDIAVYNNVRFFWCIGMNTGHGFDGPGSRTESFLFGDGPNQFCDFNGDGLTDRIEPFSDKCMVHLSNGSGFETPKSWFDLGCPGRQLVDINGDGKCDLLFSHRALISTGSNFIEKAISYCAVSGGELLPDVTGDGLPDKICMNGTYGDNYHSFFQVFERWNSTAFLLWSVHHATDLDGNGITELLMESPTLEVVQLQDSSYPDLVVSINDGYNQSLQISYGPLVHGSYYQKGSGAALPIIDYAGPMHVVTSWSMISCGHNVTRELKYAGGRSHLRRGFLGFSSITEQYKYSDSKLLKVIKSCPHPDWRARALLQTQETWLGGVLVEQINNTIKILEKNQHVATGVINETVKVQMDPKGAFLAKDISYAVHDKFGKVTNITQINQDGFVMQTLFSYIHNESAWLIGLADNITTTKTAPAQPSHRVETIYSYDNYGYLTSEVVAPQTNYSVRYEYTYDNFGNKNKHTISGQNSTSLNTHMVFSPCGRFAQKFTDAMQLTINRKYDSRFGLVTEETTMDGTTVSSYDSFGRLLNQSFPSGGVIRKTYISCSSTTCPVLKQRSQPVYFVERMSNDEKSIEYFDAQDRVIHKATWMFDNQIAFQEIVYNSFGYIEKASERYFEGQPVVWTVYEYDPFGRIVGVMFNDKRKQTKTYRGLTETESDELGYQTVRIKNGQGQLISIIDDMKNCLNISYDSAGNQIQYKSPLGNTIDMKYDARGRQIAKTDPNSGTINNHFSARGALLTAKDANGNTINYNYSNNGFITERVWKSSELNGKEKWVYGRSNGKLLKVSSSYTNFTEEYKYSKGLLLSTIATVHQQQFAMSNSYDQYGRLAQLTYPKNKLQIRYLYSHGMVTAIVNATDNSTIWRLDAVNSRGQPTRVTFGNDLVGLYEYKNTGHVSRITLQQSLKNLIDESIIYDAHGNPITKTDHVNDITETYSYDTLHQLSQVTMQNSLGSVSEVVLQYNADGNLVSKSDVGLYHYDLQQQPNAVSKIEDEETNTIIGEYKYDNNGNRIEGPREKISYSWFNKPTKIESSQLLCKDMKCSSNPFTITFEYQHNHNLFRQNFTFENRTWTRLIISKYYEELISPSGKKTCLYHIYGPTEHVASFIETETSFDIQYSHLNHLSSLIATSNKQGHVTSRQYYDAFGMKYSDVNRLVSVSQEGPLTEPAISSFGFTMHRHLDQTYLIHMGGRVYDSHLGLFLSPDPVSLHGMTPHAFNPYSYALNQPLRLVDPSGYKPLKKWGSLFAGIGLAVFTGGGAAALGVGQLGTAIATGAGFGFGRSAASTLLDGGSPASALQAGAQGALVGGAAGAAFYGLASVANIPWSPSVKQDLASLVKHSMYESGNELMRDTVSQVASKMRIRSPALNSVLFAMSLVGNSLTGSRVQQWHPNEAFSISGVNSRPGLFSYFFDATDCLLAVQGLPTATSLDILFGKNDVRPTAHSLGTMDLLNLKSYGFFSGQTATALAVPMVKLASPPETESYALHNDPIAGGQLAAAFRPGVHMAEGEGRICHDKTYYIQQLHLGRFN